MSRLVVVATRMAGRMSARLIKLTVVISLFVMFTPSLCLATAYGRNGYSACHYNEGCSNSVQDSEHQPSLSSRVSQTIVSAWTNLAQSTTKAGQAAENHLKTTPINSRVGAVFVSLLLILISIGIVIIVTKRKKDTSDEEGKE